MFYDEVGFCVTVYNTHARHLYGRHGNLTYRARRRIECATGAALALRRYGSVGGGMEGKEGRHFHASERGKVS